MIATLTRPMELQPNDEEIAYISLCKSLLDAPLEPNRTGVPARVKFHEVLKFSLARPSADGFVRVLPLITSKFTAFHAVYHELIWFLRGCGQVAGEGDTSFTGNTDYLIQNGIKIWDGNTTREFLDKSGLHDLAPGQTGPIYGVQWRNWGGKHDQLAEIIAKMIADPHDRRLIVSAWNVDDLPKMCLMPCHYSFQFVVTDGKLNCLVNMRSADIALGVPFNIASYALLTHIVSTISGITPGQLSISMANCHLYDNHVEGVKKMITRVPYPFPTIALPRAESGRAVPKNVCEVKAALARFSHVYTFDDYAVDGYKRHPMIKLSMAV